MIIPFAAGGPSDAIGRVMAERMKGVLGQPVVVENVAGANGSIAVARVARATPDGYTFILGGWSTFVANGALYALPYDLRNDFETVGLVSTMPLVVVARHGLPANDLRQLIAWLKANPDKASQGHPGVGNIGHVAGVLFQKETGTRFQFIPYRGAGPAMQDLVAGQIDLMMADPVTAIPQVRAGTIKAYAVMAKSQLSSAPAIPTTDGAGLTGLHVSTWNAAFAPKGTPKEAIGKLSLAVMDALADANGRKQLLDLGQDVPPREEQTPDALSRLQRADIEKWWTIIKAANIKGE